MPLIYVNYARRSSDEGSKKQAQSIEDQLKDTRRVQWELGLDVRAELTESRTAKEPGRPVFNQMIRSIEKGQVNAILCWKLDRLARNPIDAATLRWLMRKGKLLEIRTPYHAYKPEDNAVITAVENAMAEQYIIDLKNGVERGMRSKCEKGGFPLRAPSGYLNNRLTRTVEVDEKCFPLLRRAWELLLDGTHSVPQIHDLLVNEWGYRNPASKGSSDGRLTLSGLYKIFANTFYMGTFQFQGIRYTHNYPRMVTKDEWERAQAIVSGRGCRRVQRHVFTYTGVLTCASCGFAVTAETAKGHTYYHCSNRLRICTKKGIREEKIEAQIEELLEQVSIDEEMEDLALGILAEMREDEQSAQESIRDHQESAVQDFKRQKDALLNLYLQGHLEPDEYAAKKKEISEQETGLKLGGQQATGEAARADKKIKDALSFAANAQSLFAVAGSEQKRQLARQLGLEFVLLERELTIQLHPLLEKVRTEMKTLPKINGKFEPSKSGSGSWRVDHSSVEFQRWCSWLHEVRTMAVV